MYFFFHPVIFPNTPPQMQLHSFKAGLIAAILGTHCQDPSFFLSKANHIWAA